MLIKGQRWSEEGLGVFLRGGVSPSDRNQVPFYLDGGISYKGLFAGREEDTLALGVGYGQISGSLQGLDRDTRKINGQDPSRCWSNRGRRCLSPAILLSFRRKLLPLRSAIKTSVGDV